MGVLALNYPEEIQWERVCVSKDMEDESACDDHMPPRWSSSMALYRFVPDQTQQPYEKRRLLYFKLTVTIAPYQLYDEEIDRLLSMKLADLSTDPVVKDYQQASTLAQALPAFGAVVQLSVTADAKDAGSPPDTYIMDVQPKQRTLYETVSETKEVASRSLEGLNVGKGSATTHSLEVVDVDHGGSAGVG